MIFQNSLPYEPFPARPMPGIRPVGPEGWLQVDDAYAAQMAERARLMDACPEDVVWQDPLASDALAELLEVVLASLPAGFARSGHQITRPDGVVVTPDGAAPLRALGQLVQEDFCLLMRDSDAPEHVLRAAILCFPANWTLAEKAGQPLLRIHAPVDSYDADLARRVQRLFDGVQPGRPLWRNNALWYDDATLFAPSREGSHPPKTDPRTAPYLRSERQCIVRLPRTRAVVFSIHTYMLRRAAVEAAGHLTRA